MQVRNVISALEIVALEGHGGGAPERVISIVVPPHRLAELVLFLFGEQRDVGGGEGERRPVRLPLDGERVGLSLQDGLCFRTLEIDIIRHSRFKDTGGNRDTHTRDTHGTHWRTRHTGHTAHIK